MLKSMRAEFTLAMVIALTNTRARTSFRREAMLTDQEKALVRRTWRLVVPIAETAADLFYKRLFELRPEYRQLFPENMAAQKRKLLQMLAFVVKSLDFPESAWRSTVPLDEDLLYVVLALGRRHRDLYKIPGDSYAVVGEALLWTLDYGLGEAFTPEVRGAWLHVYQLLASTMRMGATLIDSAAAHAAISKVAELGRAALAADTQGGAKDDLDFSDLSSSH
jgi:hemoglobin-like flavoprotein